MNFAENDYYDVPYEYSLFECEDCGKDIFEGEYYLEINGTKICEDCVQKMMKYAEREEEQC